MIFRSDINALRGLSVLAVVVFHFHAPWLPGGFAGVDVFFVISGYLMAAIVISRLESALFSLRDFYLSRANRIIPALSALCLVLMVAGFFMLSPRELVRLAEEVQRAILFYSNIHYAEQMSLSEIVTTENWLIHTWSLAVEFQFYLLFPVITLLCYRLGGIKAVIGAILIIGAVSVGVALIHGYKPIIGGYYPTQTRIWELLTGSLVFVLARHSLNIPVPRGLSLIGYAMILLSFVLVSLQDVWPGPWTLLPVAGAALVILGHHESSITRNEPLQWIGRISYSLYLWHWPVVVAFHKAQWGLQWIPLGIAVALCLASLSYYGVERCRLRPSSSYWYNAGYLSVPLVILITLMLGALQILDHGGFPERFLLGPNQHPVMEIPL